MDAIELNDCVQSMLRWILCCGELNKILKHICVISANGNGQTVLPACVLHVCTFAIEAIGAHWGRWEMTFGNHIEPTYVIRLFTLSIKHSIRQKSRMHVFPFFSLKIPWFGIFPFGHHGPPRFAWKSILFSGCSVCSTATAAALVEFPRFWCCFYH